MLSQLCFLASSLGHRESLGCLVLTARVTPSVSQSPGASLAPCRGCDLASRSLNALVVTIVNSGSIVRSLWLFITSLFAGASAQRSVDSDGWPVNYCIETRFPHTLCSAPGDSNWEEVGEQLGWGWASQAVCPLPHSSPTGKAGSRGSFSEP